MTINIYNVVYENTHLEHGNQFLFWYADAVSVHAVNDVYDGIRVGVVASPVRAYACLTAEIPDLKLEVLVLHRLDIETNCCKQALTF